MVRATSILSALAMLSGCAVTTADGERLAAGSDAFRDYVERVFREQNRVASDIAFALEAEGLVPARERALDAAERALLDACAALNALAAARRDGDDLGPIARARAASSGPECERATRAAVRVLRAGPND